jgi:hypothetical protein
MDIRILSMLSSPALITYLQLDSNWLNGANGVGQPGAQDVSYYGLSLEHLMLYGRGTPNITTGAYT